MIFGLLNINKPSGPTSHDIVAGTRRGLHEKRVGHAGTLDPMASGVLIVAVGPATRLVEYLTASQKTYLAQVTLGVTTDSHDAQGEIVSRRPVPPNLTRAMLESALVKFRGPIMQKPPVYSAIKVGGKSAHARIRAGQVVDLAPRPVTVYSLDLLSVDLPVVELRVVCSPGTYIRSLAHDLGEALGCGAMLSHLVRIASGQFRVEEAVGWSDLQSAFAAGSWSDYIIPADRALEGAPQITLSEPQLSRVRNGAPYQDIKVTDGVARAYAADGRFVAVLQGDSAAGLWQPVKVFAEVLAAM